MNKGKQIALTGLILTLFGIIGSSIVGVTFENTSDIIAENDRRAMLRTLNQILPAEKYDNNLVADTLQLAADNKLGQTHSSTAYLAKKNNIITAVIFSVNATDGYNGEIRLLIGVNANGTLSGVRVVKHNETPGLGDTMERKRGDWILSFDGKSINQPVRSDWRVKRDGGVFDQFTGATITPRAIVKAVRQCLIYFDLHKKTLLRINNETNSQS
jgi:electron transport complex protein RnfG